MTPADLHLIHMAADAIREQAYWLRASHTVGGEWDSVEDRDEYGHLMTLVFGLDEIWKAKEAA